MLTLKKAEHHAAFFAETKMAESIINITKKLFDKISIECSDVMSDIPFKDSLGLKIDSFEIYYDKELSTYLVLEESYDAGDWYSPPDIQIEVAATFASFPKALEYVMHQIVTGCISAQMERESEEFFDNLPQV